MLTMSCKMAATSSESTEQRYCLTLVALYMTCQLVPFIDTPVNSEPLCARVYTCPLNEACRGWMFMAKLLLRSLCSSENCASIAG